MSELNSADTVRLELDGSKVFHRLIASKVNHGFQIDFITTSGEIHSGFPIGLDENWVQIYVTGGGQNEPEYEEGKPLYEDDAFEVKHPRRKWLQVRNIECVEESFFGLRHLTPSSRERINNERSAMIKASNRYLQYIQPVFAKRKRF